MLIQDNRNFTLRRELIALGVNVEFFDALDDKQMNDLLAGLKKIAEIYVNLSK